MLLAVAKQEVDNSSNDREDEDKNSPEDLVRDWAVGLDEFDCEEQCQR